MTTLPRDFAERERQRMWARKESDARMDPYRRAEYDAGLDCDETPTERDERIERGASRWSE